MEYRVKLNLFEGPLDLLLYLIRKNELNIYDIPISAITEQYLQYIKMMKGLNLDIASEYLVMAATLTQIKSRMLLPTPEEGEAEEEDPRAELIRQLLEYQKYKEAADTLISREILGRDTFVRSMKEEEILEPEGPGVEASLFELLDAFRSVLKKAADANAGEEVLSLEDVSQYRISLAQRMDEVLLLLGKAIEKYPVEQGIPFEELFEGRMTRGFIIATFLSLLELIRQKLVRIFQLELFGQIWVRPRLAPVEEPVPETQAETTEKPMLKPPVEPTAEPAVESPAGSTPEPTEKSTPPLESQTPVEPTTPADPQNPINDSPVSKGSSGAAKSDGEKQNN